MIEETSSGAWSIIIILLVVGAIYVSEDFTAGNFKLKLEPVTIINIVASSWLLHFVSYPITESCGVIEESSFDNNKMPAKRKTGKGGKRRRNNQRQEEFEK